jgi:hypothetical protein
MCLSKSRVFASDQRSNESLTLSFHSTLITAVAALVAPIVASPAAQSPNEFFSLAKRATLPVPASKGSVTYTKPQSVSGTFDGGLKTYGRGASCTGQAEGGDSDAVFILENGATLKNAIIGKGTLLCVQESVIDTDKVRRPD